MTQITRGRTRDVADQGIYNIPILGPLALRVRRALAAPFPGSEQYWVHHYAEGGNSGPGSYNKLAEFKAEIINGFVREHAISSVIEFGCGDGNQLQLAQYPQYSGYDVSPRAIALCREKFQNDQSKVFHLVSDYRGETAQLALSLDVIFHLVEDDTFQAYMARLCDAADQYLLIYASNTELQRPDQPPEVRHREFTTWIAAQRPQWQLLAHIPNRYPYQGKASQGSHADFYIFSKPGNEGAQLRGVSA